MTANFHFFNALLHEPMYREKTRNFKRDLPLCGAGKALMDLHIGYEVIESWPRSASAALLWARREPRLRSQHSPSRLPRSHKTRHRASGLVSVDNPGDLHSFVRTWTQVPGDG